MKKIILVISIAILICACMKGEKGDRYMVIDLSGGPAAKSYPVSYLHSIPKGGWGREYKTTKLVLQRVEPGIFNMGSPTNECGRWEKGEDLHQVTLSKPYYLGVFEVTQRQWELVTGARPSAASLDSCYQTRPVENVSYDMIRGAGAGRSWPSSAMVDKDSFVGILREKTGEVGIDLPTEAQWEFACRAGTTTPLNTGMSLVKTGKVIGGGFIDEHVINSNSVKVWDIARCDPKGDAGELEVALLDTSKFTAEVGSYPTNAWGFYDMIGNVGEWCLDAYCEYEKGHVVDPRGGVLDTVENARVVRDGRWNSYIQNCRSASRFGVDSEICAGNGLRLCCMENPYENCDDSAVFVDNRIGAIAGIELGKELKKEFMKNLKEVSPFCFGFRCPPSLCGIAYAAGRESFSSVEASRLLHREGVEEIGIGVLSKTKEVFGVSASFNLRTNDFGNAHDRFKSMISDVENECGVKLRKRDELFVPSFDERRETYYCGTRGNWVTLDFALMDAEDDQESASYYVFLRVQDDELIWNRLKDLTEPSSGEDGAGH